MTCYWHSKNEAITHWNTRAESARQQPQVSVELPAITKKFRITALGEVANHEGNEWFCHAHEVKAYMRAVQAALTHQGVKINYGVPVVNGRSEKGDDASVAQSSEGKASKLSRSTTHQGGKMEKGE